MKLSGLLSTAILLGLPSIASAAPATNTLHRRDCPSVDTIEQWIEDNKPDVGENTIFYTAGAKQVQAENFAATLDQANYWGKVWARSDDEPIFWDWLEECGAGSEQDKLFPRMGEALARQSSGTAYVIMVKGQAINNFWLNNEYPYLKDRVKITAVNADDFEDTKDYDENPFRRSIMF